MSESVLTRLWNTIKPPPAVRDRDHPKKGLNPKQKTMIWGTVVVVVLIVGGWQTYVYVTSAPLRAQKLFTQAMGRMTPGRYQEAIDLFSKAVDVDPQMAVGYLERGNAENIVGQKEAAFADYEKAIEVGNLAAAFTARGMVYLSRNDAKKAEDDFMRSIGVEPTSDAYYQLGQIHQSQGNFAKAIDDYSQAIHVQPDAPYIYRTRRPAKTSLSDEAGAISDRNDTYGLEHRLRK